jgi:predicted transcriptional regulator
MNSANANRVRARAIIFSLPGIHLRMLQRVLGTSFSTARYHASNLEKEGEVVRRSDKRYERLYPRGTTEAMQSVYAILQRRTMREILQVAVDLHDQSPTIADLANRAGLSPSTVAASIKQMEDAGLIARLQGRDGRLRCEIRDRDLVLGLLAGFRRNIIDVAADNLIDLWDF